MAVSIILIVFASIAVLGVTTFIIQRYTQLETVERNTRCVYLAQAGIHNALYFYRFRKLTGNGYFSLGQTNIDANNFFVVGGTAADLLMVDASASYVGGTSNKYLYGLRLQNATNSKTITLNRMVVTWNNSWKLTTIRIAGSNRWTGNLSSPANCVFTSNVALNTTPSTYAINYLLFNNAMTGATISIQFFMTDGSSRSLVVLPASTNYNFTVKSTGKTAGSNMFRTIQADYNTLTGKVFNYDEINTEIVP